MSDVVDAAQEGAAQENETHTFSVTEALMLAKGTLESLVIKVVGEVSEVSAKSGYKAVYFSVKDEKSSLSCLMWNNRYQKLGIDLQVGQLVEMTGRFTLYAAKGRMNFEALSISLAGEGNLRLQVANLAKKLEAQGLMDPARKKPLPLYPEKIGLVTSPRGAAVHDVLRTLRRRFPVAQVYLAGVPVEGAQAPAALMTGIRCVYDAGVDVVLLVRGGGSYEDLMPFNDERLAITISRCPIPVVTGIGHEPDTCIADMVADVRASTPTAAAEAVSPSRESMDAVFARSERGLTNPVKRAIEQTGQRLASIEARPLFTDSMYLVSEQAQGIDLLSLKLNGAIPQNLKRDEAALMQMETRLSSGLAHLLPARADRAEAQRLRLAAAGQRTLDVADNAIAARAARLNDLSPLTVLSRGYAMARAQDGALVSRVGQVSPGDALAVSVADGVIDCTVNDVQEVIMDFEPLKEGQ